jgi:trk system potassium uptake protein
MEIRNKILIIGIGRLGASIANRASEKGANVVAIDNDAASFDYLDDNYNGFKVRGDASDIAFLESDCFLKSCKEAIVTTGDDNLNLFLSRVLSEHFGVPHIFVRFDSPEKSLLIKDLSTVEAIFPFKLSFDEFCKLEGNGKS